MALKFGSIMTLFESTFSMAWNQYLFRIVTEEKQKIMVVHMLEVVVPIYSPQPTGSALPSKIIASSQLPQTQMEITRIRQQAHHSLRPETSRVHRGMAHP